VIRSKTAKLFEASAQLGAMLAGASPEQEAACATYGQALGTAFQIIDDVLDYTATPPKWARTWAMTCAKANAPCR
jgi:octaprenyl-diphosphate synthase